MKVNPFWPTAGGGPAPMFGAKPCNLNVIPSAEMHGNVSASTVNSVADKGQSIAIFPGHTGKDRVPQAGNIPESTHRKQQILLQQALPPVAPNNILVNNYIFYCISLFLVMVQFCGSLSLTLYH